MTEKEFERSINHELEWLKYYADYKSREKLNSNSDLYNDLITMGYTKRSIPLDRRCPYCILTSDTKINEYTNIEDLRMIFEDRDSQNNKFTPLEILWMSPEKREWIIKKLC